MNHFVSSYRKKMSQENNMQIFLIAFPVFLVCFITGGVQSGAIAETTPVNNTGFWNCKESETECLFGCCPVRNGVCCLDGKHCCKKGQFCIPFVGKCIGFANTDGQISLDSEKALSLSGSALTCSAGMTECAGDSCCPYEQGVCCEDEEHCCPNGYRCDIPNKKCIPNDKITNLEKPLRKMSIKSSYASCPGGHRMCPSYMDCCVNDNGNWDCCPKASLPKIQYGSGQCCASFFGGHICCPDNYPVCSAFGCTKSDASNDECVPGYSTTSPDELHKKGAMSSYKSCPGGNQICPGNMSCCVNDSGDWDCCLDPSLPKIENHGHHPVIVGGRPAEEGEFPWMVSLHYRGRFICSSFLITPKILMTAAHCVILFGNLPESPQNYLGYVGTIRRDGPDTLIRFTEIIPHCKYGPGTEYDIALMKLAEPVEINEKIQTICLPQSNAVHEDMIAEAMGWGVTIKGGKQSAEILQTNSEYVPTNEECSSIYGRFGIPVTKRHVCAGGEKDKGICFGDSGGPLVANEPRPIAIGVASFITSKGCAEEGIPGVYTNVASYIDWITEKIGEEEAAKLCFLDRKTSFVSSLSQWFG